MRNVKSIEEILKLHEKFWEKSNTEPLIDCRTGGIFPVSYFSVSERLLSEKREIRPDMLNVEEFLLDYERLFNESKKNTFTDCIWSADPYSPIPWVEAMLGCRVVPGNNSFSSLPCIDSPSQLTKLRIDFEGAWAKKYSEFLVNLDRLSGGRFPIGQPILRGLLDCLGAVIGQTQAIYALYDNEEEVSTFIKNLTDDYISLIEYHFAHIKPFHNGAAFFSIWTPDKCLKYQDDLTSIAAPWVFDKYLKDSHNKMCSSYNYSAFHLHPASFFILDNLLCVDKLGAIQIQKDFGGPTVAEMLPQFKKVLRSKRLIISGNFTLEELDLIFNELPPGGLLLHVITDTVEEYVSVLDYISEKKN